MKFIKKIILLFASMFCLSLIGSFVLMPKIETCADTGPKPTIEIRINNLEKSDYIVSYATKNEDYFGPHHSFIPGDEIYGVTDFGNENHLSLLYSNVELPEGWYLSDISSFHENTSELVLMSGYYWPSDFILIIYDNISNKYYLSEETIRYAFNAYYTCDMSNYTNGLVSLSEAIELKNSYNYVKEIGHFFVRILFTLGIEILVAFLFRMSKKSYKIILIVNVLTQFGLNLFLNLSSYFSGISYSTTFFYLFFEFVVFLIEAVVYKLTCYRGKTETKRWLITYAFAANVLSFLLGMSLWFIL